MSDSHFVFLHIGDNILTAVNVAKSCGMVGSDDRVIFVHATPHTAQSTPTLRFHLGEGGATTAAGSVEVITQVGPLIRHSPLLLSLMKLCNIVKMLFRDLETGEPTGCICRSVRFLWQTFLL